MAASWGRVMPQNLTFASTGRPCYARERANHCLGIDRGRELRAYQHSIRSGGCYSGYIGNRLHSAFRYRDDLAWDQGQKAERSLRVDLQRFQISVVDADQAGVERKREIELPFVAHLYENFDTKVIAGLCPLLQPLPDDRPRNSNRRGCD